MDTNPNNKSSFRFRKPSRAFVFRAAAKGMVKSKRRVSPFHFTAASLQIRYQEFELSDVSPKKIETFVTPAVQPSVTEISRPATLPKAVTPASLALALRAHGPGASARRIGKPTISHENKIVRVELVDIPVQTEEEFSPGPAAPEMVITSVAPEQILSEIASAVDEIVIQDISEPGPKFVEQSVEFVLAPKHAQPTARKSFTVKPATEFLKKSFSRARHSLAKFKRKSVPKKERKPVSLPWAAVKELFKFSLVSATTFVVVLTVMNFSAYTQMAGYWLSKWQGQDMANVKDLQALVDNVTAADRLQVADLGGIPFLPKAGPSVPAVDLDVIAPDNRIVLPKIGKNVPIVELPDTNLVKGDWQKLEQDIQQALKDGVVHYPGTAMPGQVGNFFVTGHSSYYFWERSKYKDVFALLPELDVGDRVTVYYNQKKYDYEITDKKIVNPSNVDVLKQTDDNRITLMTCFPVGTDLNRMILVGKQI